MIEKKKKGFKHDFLLIKQIQFEDSYFQENKDEFNIFWNTFKVQLPVVFRINKLTPNYEIFLNNIKDKDFIKKYIEKQKKKQIDQQKDKSKLFEINEKKLNDQEKCNQEEEANKAINDQNEQKNQQSSKYEESNESEEEDQNNDDYKVDESAQKDGKNMSKRFEFQQEEIYNLKINNIKFYPDELVWQINCNRSQLKKSNLLKEFHKYILMANDSGIISRQELVSMIPPLLLDVKPNDIIFDMCAAPGSKTAQLLELMYSQGGINTKGCVVANDIDQKRAYLLTHQVCRINPSGLVVINHPAQFFPVLKNPNYDKKFYFDKILADVPCSGDGATRKIPTQWRNWNTKDGQALHPLQLAILQRALTLCKVGGYVLYSTCSINPIEDEAVITEAFRRANPNSMELIDIHSKYPDIKGRQGLATWKVCSSTKKHPGYAKDNKETINDWLKFYDNFELIDLNDQFAQFVKESMFPDTKEKMLNEIKIQNTMRILPHDQDTGGFYLALIKKTAEITWNKTFLPNSINSQTQNELQQQKQEEDNLFEEKQIPKETENLQNIQGDIQEGKNSKNKDVVQKEIFTTIPLEEWENIKENYGVEGIDKSLFIVNNYGKQKVVRLITEGAKLFLDCDLKGIVIKVNMGTKCFERTRESQKNIKCKFRICQDSVNLISPYITKRIIIIFEEDFKFFISNKAVKYSEIPNQQLKNQISALGQGSIVLFCQKYNDYIVCQNFHQSVNIMISKEVTESFKIRYLQQLL